MDNLLFEKAYTHMISILQQFPSPISKLPAASATDERSFTNPRQLFSTKKLYLMAMIAFLNSCHEAVASEEKVGESKPDEDIVYQWDLSGPSSSQQPLQPSGTVASDLTTNAASIESVSEDLKSMPLVDPKEGKKVTDEASEEYLLSLIHVSNETELLALPEDIFNTRVKKISSLKTRGKIRDIRSDIQYEIKKAKEQEEAIKRAAEREARIDDFYATAKITRIVTDKNGDVIGWEIDCDPSLLG